MEQLSKQELAKKLVQLRKSKGYSQEELAKANVDLEQLKLLVADESAKLEAVQSKLAEIRGSI